MKRLLQNRQVRFRRPLRWAMLCLTLTWLVGCQSMLKGKAKSKAQDRFSCGERLPGQIP